MRQPSAVGRYRWLAWKSRKGEHMAFVLIGEYGHNVVPDRTAVREPGNEDHGRSTAGYLHAERGAGVALRPLASSRLAKDATRNANQHEEHSYRKHLRAAAKKGAIDTACRWMCAETAGRRNRKNGHGGKVKTDSPRVADFP